MFKYSLNSLWSRKLTTVLFGLALIVVLSISMLAVNIYSQVQEGFFKTDGKYDIVIGPKGSATSLVMSSMFFANDPIGTIPYQDVVDLQAREDVESIIPLGMGDSYRGAAIVGTTPDLLKGLTWSDGKAFDSDHEAVVGYEIAKQFGLKVGDKLVSSHGLGEGVHTEHKNEPYRLVGVLDKTSTAYDNTVFTTLESVWGSHGIGAHDHVDKALENIEHYGEHGVEEPVDERSVTSILVRSGSMQVANNLIQEYKQDEYAQAINPTQTLRSLMSNLDLSKQVAQILCFIIIALSFIVMAIMSVLMYESNKKDVQTLKFIGLSRGVIAKFVFYQNIFLVSLGVLLSIVVSRSTLHLANTISSKMGIVLDVSKVYTDEYMVVGVVAILCLAPVVLQLKRFSRELN